MMIRELSRFLRDKDWIYSFQSEEGLSSKGNYTDLQFVVKGIAAEDYVRLCRKKISGNGR